VKSPIIERKVQRILPVQTGLHPLRCNPIRNVLQILKNRDEGEENGTDRRPSDRRIHRGELLLGKEEKKLLPNHSIGIIRSKLALSPNANLFRDFRR